MIHAVARASVTDGTALLMERDPVLAMLIDRHGPPPGRKRVPTAQRFGSLAEIIVYQQLAGSAAATIHARLELALGGTVSLEAVLASTPDVLSSCGLSGSKAASIRDLAERVVSGSLELERIGRLSDQAIVEQLTEVRGIGPWTAQMFLVDTLGRLDVWPVGDYGVRTGFGQAWGMAQIPTPKELAVLGDPFRPYRSLVAWYCWRAVDDRTARA
jgi:DNA-3-methyladenine glycosylase II